MREKIVIFSKLSFLLLLLTYLSLGNCEIDPVVQKSIDDLIANYFIPEGHVSGLGLTIVKDGNILYTQGYGNRDVENSIPANNDSLFYIGSISKSFTAAIVIKVLSENFPALGERALDTPISVLIPSYNLTLSDRYRSERTTFRDLLAHRVDEVPENDSVFNGAVTEIDELIYRLRYANESSAFRTSFVYNNGHFSLAGDIAAKISEVSYDKMLEELMSDIGMTNSTYLKQSDDHDNMPNRALGYYWKDNKLNRYNAELYKRVIPMNPAGGILSSANDMAKYLQFHMNKGKVDDKEIIPEGVMKWFEKNSNPSTPSIWKSQAGEKIPIYFGYSLGLSLGSYDGWQMLTHSGYLPPFHSLLTLFPGLKLGIFTGSSGPGLIIQNYTHNLLHYDIFDVLQGDKPLRQQRVPSASKNESLEDNDKPNVNTTQPISNEERRIFQATDIIGHYGNGISGELDVIEKLNGTGQMDLYAMYGKWYQGWLRKTSEESFTFVLDTDLIQDSYSYGMTDLEITVTYEGANDLKFAQKGLDGSITNKIFYKNQTLADLPVQPWSPDSCGPEN